MTTTPEGKVKRQIDAMLKAHGVWFFKPVSNGLGAHGIPDYICCVKGRFLGIEAKSDSSKKPTTLQEMQMNNIRAASGNAIVVHKDNLEDLRWLLEHLQRDSE